jgi:two-component system, OmpR family, phosphate regulon sensor histidine kinase PhoR
MSQSMPFADFSAMLLTMAGHDLRHPLQLIVAAHDKLAQSLGGSGLRRELAQAENAAAQLSRMLGQLVNALQLRERAVDRVCAPVRLRPIFESLTAEFAEPARLRGVALRVASGGGAALSHPVLLTGILRNLIRNAIDYTPPGGAVFVTSRERGPELRIEVRDTGAGIRASSLPTIFKALQQSDGSHLDGLGLGLFIVKHAADLLGHRIEVRSAKGRGSCFAIIADPAAQAAPSPRSRCEKAAAQPNADPIPRPIRQSLTLQTTRMTENRDESRHIR